MARRVLPLFCLLFLAFDRGATHNRQPAPDESPARQYFTDVSLVNQNGETLRLYSDLLQGKIVIINSFFTSCENSCPRMSGILAGLQERLGARLGRDVFLLSFTVDPQTDTPERLKAYGERFHAKPGWIFLTGPTENVQFALNKLGQKVDHKEEHFNLFIVGNEATGLWKKVLPMRQSGEMLSAAELMEIVDTVIHDRP